MVYINLFQLNKLWSILEKASFSHEAAYAFPYFVFGWTFYHNQDIDIWLILSHVFPIYAGTSSFWSALAQLQLKLNSTQFELG